jgi:hypothetical protein
MSKQMSEARPPLLGCGEIMASAIACLPFDKLRRAHWQPSLSITGGEEAVDQAVCAAAGVPRVAALYRP